jgi:hypothetical protein
MTNGYSRSPLLLKGALIEFSERFIGPIPNIVIFQYNPETLIRTLSVYNPFQSDEQTPGAPPKIQVDAQPGDPSETFDLVLELDATDELEKGDPIAVVTGVADRVSALEMLLYPQEGSLLGELLGSISASVGGGGAGGGATAAEATPRGSVPVVLFVWGPGRIVPVRLTSFQVEEQAFSPILYPVHAKVTVGLQILTDKDLANLEDSLSKDIAIAAFKYTRSQKQVLAAANLANAVESILGMLPF